MHGDDIGIRIERRKAPSPPIPAACCRPPPRAESRAGRGPSLCSISSTHSISSSRTATTMSVTSGEATNFRTVCTRMGAPSSSMNCLRLVPVVSAGTAGTPRCIRVPSPAAGRMTAVFTRSALLPPPAPGAERSRRSDAVRMRRRRGGAPAPARRTCRKSSFPPWSAERW